MLRWSGLGPGEAERIRAAGRVLAHRGPDSEGFWHDTHCALAFRRLKVIDLSPAGEQPMATESGEVHVVFNGEVYNFRELRAELEAKAHVFRSSSDTEVLLHGYEEWGLDELLARLRGMFAFALWDARYRRLILARDRLGVKPLYFAERGDAVLFASEPKALFATGLVRPELDPPALHEALTYRYVPAPRSGFKDVEKLPPGSVATAEKGRLVYLRWWKCDEAIRATADDVRIAVALTFATSRRLVADVPLGAWLSGGVDSGLVVAGMCGFGKVRSFCAGFAQPEYDERGLARRTAAHCETAHAEFEIPADVFKLLPQVVWHADEPYFDSSCLPTFVLAQETKKHVTVVLSGDGGDEAFGGYERYVALQIYPRWKGLGRLLRWLVLSFARLRGGAHSRQGWDRIARWLEACRRTEAQGFHPYLAAMELFSQDQIRTLYGEGLAEENAELDGREHLAGALRLAAQELGLPTGPGLFPATPAVLQRADLHTYLPGDVLHKVDRMSMAHGLEVRSPFLEADLVSLALALPDATRLSGLTTKPVLRRLAKAALPLEVAQARKRGFGVPLDDWFRGPLEKTAREVFESSRLAAAGLFRPRYWEPLWQEHQARRAQHGERLYALLALEFWYRQFLDGAPALERPAAL